MTSSAEFTRDLPYTQAGHEYELKVVKKLNSIWKKNSLEKDIAKGTIVLNKNGKLAGWYIPFENTQNDKDIIIKTIKKASPYGKVKYAPNAANTDFNVKINLIFTNEEIKLNPSQDY